MDFIAHCNDMPDPLPSVQDVDVPADFVIVGAGSAGAALAARLSEDPARQVVLMEAGRDTPPGAVPADVADTFPRSYSNPDYMWPGLLATGLAGAAARPFTQGRIMGGGSSLMGMWALRGLAADYDHWRDAGATGWGWSDVLPYFERLQRDPMPTRRIAQHDWPGYICALQQAASALGYPLRSDINTSEADGFFPIPLSQDAAVRASSPHAYLTPQVRRRANLRIVTDTEATRLDMEGTRVRGVLARRAGAGAGAGTSLRFAAREVVLCAGAIHSPALLLRSGIGPAQEIAALGVQVVADRPGVGRNLQNHVCINIGLTLPASQRQAGALRNYGVACMRVSSKALAGEAADLLLAFIGRTSMRPIGARLGVLGIFLYGPRSRGSVTLSGTGQTLHPQVRFNLLEDPSDAARLAQGLGLALQLLGDPASAGAWQEAFMLPAAAPLHRLNRPGLMGKLQGLAGVAAFGASAWSRRAAVAALVGRDAFLQPAGKEPISPQRLHSLVRQSATPMFHVAGTCAMGRADDRAAVVDPQCRVHGVQGLRVVDASIMPRVPRANTNIPAIMVAERAADLIVAQSRQA
ncbi:MAG: hypothetical protein JWP52_1531 [Rhizobacter sp.]|nr:hypothetical protein [Rhizobacter sp.]